MSVDQHDRATRRPSAGEPASHARRKAKAQLLSEGKKAERRLGWLLCAPAALVMVAVTAYPIIYSVWLSLQRYDLKFPDQREFIGLENYVTVLTNEYWWTAFGVTALITVVSVADRAGARHGPGARSCTARWSAAGWSARRR